METGANKIQQMNIFEMNNCKKNISFYRDQMRKNKKNRNFYGRQIDFMERKLDELQNNVENNDNLNILAEKLRESL